MKRKTAALLTVLVLAALALGSLAGAEVVQKGSLRVIFDGALTPRSLPRSGVAPVHVSVSAKIATTNGSEPPQLRTMTIAINSAGHFDPSLLPICTVRDIQPSTTENALKACGESLVGQGYFKAKVLLGQNASFPAAGKLYAFNGRFDGHPAILAHVFGTDPVPTSFTLPFELLKSKGTFGTVLRASLPAVTGKSGHITGLSLNLGRTVGSGSGRRSYLSAGCPAPKGFPGATFPFARATFSFAHASLTSTLNRNCKVSR